MCNLELDFTSPRVMAICNVTDDSFYEKSRISNVREFATTAISLGAYIIDIGGCSTRPGSNPVSAEEEYRRVEEAFKALRSEVNNARISIDTYRSEIVGRMVEKFGPSFIVNDISGGELDSKMFDVISKWNLPYIIGHIKGTPKDMMDRAEYSDLIKELLGYFDGKIRNLRSKGVSDIIIDPNFGFAKDVNHNIELIKGISRFKSLGTTLMAGVSRKKFICDIAKCSVEDSLPLTSVVHMQLLMGGVDLIRVHDVKEAMQVVRLYEKISE